MTRTAPPIFLSRALCFFKPLYIATFVQCAKCAAQPGQVLTFMQGDRVRVIRIVTLGSRRGPAIEAVMLYEDLSPEVPKRESGAKMLDPAFESRERGAGRPTKRDRRVTQNLKSDLE